MLSLEGCRNDVPHRSRRGWHAVVALTAMTLVGCDAGGVTAPELGSMVVTTETSGFMKAEGYDLAVDGVSNGPIGANGEITISELDPGEYQVTLADVPANCTAEGATVTVEAGQAADVSLPVTCAFAEPATSTIPFDNRRPNLDTGEILECSFGICSDDQDLVWDVYAENNTSTDPQSVIRQNQQTAVEISHLPDVTLATLTEADFDGATFTTELVDTPFDANRVILVRTDLGNVYALGNPSEDTSGFTPTLTFDAALIATAAP